MAKNVPFPIKTATSCLLKWNWTTISISQGVTRSCHRNWAEPIALEDFNNFHNTEYKQEHRRAMLAGKWPESPNHLGCGYCKKIEDAGGRSDRQYMTETQHDQTPDELIDDPTATSVTPAILEVFLDNMCNLACTYCSRSYSTRIGNELDKFNTPDNNLDYFFNYKKNILSREDAAKYLDALIAWIKTNGKGLRRFHVLGGEPLIQPALDKLLDAWEEAPNPNLVINIVSNFSIPNKQFDKQINKLVHLVDTGCIDRIDITASIDCWGPEQEYVRSGFNMELVEQNILYVLNKPGIRLNINATHTLMSIGAYARLLEKKVEWEELTGKEINLYGQIVGSKHVKPHALGYDFLKDDIEQILSIHPRGTWDSDEAFKNISGIFKSLEDAKPDIEHIENFLTVYNEIDRRRNTNWKEVFPDIATEIKKHFPNLDAKSSHSRLTKTI